MFKILLIIFISLISFNLSAQEIKFQGATHEIDIGSAKISLVEKRNDPSNKICLFDTKMNSFYYYGGIPKRPKKIYFSTYSKDLTNGLTANDYKNDVERLLKKQEIPIKVVHTLKDDNGNYFKSEKIQKFWLPSNGNLIWQGVFSQITLEEGICYLDKIEFTNKYNGKLIFNSSTLKSWKTPYLAFKSCIENSDNFQFENRNSNFDKYDDMAKKCWWE